MKNSTFMGLAFFLCAIPQYGKAQVKIANFSELSAVKDSIAKVSTYETALQDAKRDYVSYKNAVNDAKSTETEREQVIVTFPQGKKEKAAISAFYNETTKDNPSGDFKLKISRETSGRGIKLTVYSPDQPIPSGVNVVELASDADFSDESILIAGANKSILSIIFNVDEGNGNYGITTVALTSPRPSTDYDVIDALMNASLQIAEKDVISTEIKETTTRVNSFLTKNQELINNENLQSYLNAALNGGTWTIKTVAWKYPEDMTKGDVVITTETSKASHPGCRNYNNLQLTNNITIDDANFTMGTVAADYKFDGAGNTVTGNNNTLFGANNGEISNVKLIGCDLVTSNNADGKISNVEVKGGKITDINRGNIKNSIVNASGSSYTVYNSKGTEADVDGNIVGTYSNIYDNADLRKEFGVNVKTGEVSMDSKYRLYEVKAYSDAKKAGERRLVNIGANGEITTHSSNAWTVGNGAFYYVTNTDAATDIFANVDAADAVANVVYTIDGTSWNCKKAVVSNSAETAIYIHEAFNAETVSYDRTFNVAAGNASTICLPFAVSESNLATVIGEGGKLLQFNKVEENGDNRTYWFKYVSNGMEANQPYILQFGNSVNGKVFNLNNVDFVATGSGSTTALEQSMEGVGASLCGTFKKQSASELEAGRYSIYGFQNGEFVRMTGETRFLPTRAYVRREGYIPTESSAKSYKMGILDENDNDVTAIASVEKAADKFSVKGGNGVITVNADKAQAVKVYTAGGALVKSEAVAAGETSISVAAGLYIVNGNKVVVK